MAESVVEGEEARATSPPAPSPSTLRPSSGQAPRGTRELEGKQRGALPHVIAIAVALAGGALGIAGAFVQELQSAGSGILLVFLGAPIIEEALKPAGVYVLLARWPQALRGQLHTASLTALAGLSFGLIESLIYVTLYFPDASDGFVLFRFTVTPAMHALASFIVGLGLDRGLIDWAAGRGLFPKRTRNAFLAGMALHAAYNTVAVVLWLAGVMEFGES